MRCTKFRIKSFKGINDLTLDLEDSRNLRISTLVGLNETGKSTILEAISFFQDSIATIDRHVLIPKSQKLDFNGVTSVEATLIFSPEDITAIQEFATSLEFSLISEPKTASIRKEYYFERSRYQKENVAWTISLAGRGKNEGRFRKLTGQDSELKKIVKFISDTLLPSILYYPNFLFTFPQRIYLQEWPGEKEEQADYRHVVQDILTYIDPALNIKDHLLDRMVSEQEQDRESLDALLHYMGNTITSVVIEQWQEVRILCFRASSIIRTSCSLSLSASISRSGREKKKSRPTIAT